MITTHGDKTRTRGNKYNLTPETARVGVQIGKVTSRVLRYMSNSIVGLLDGDGLDEIYHVIELVLLGFDP